ncbi:hypothetical protein ACE1OE_03300 [Vibrio sp. E150_011]
MKQCSAVMLSMAILSGCTPDYPGWKQKQSHGLTISGIEDEVSFKGAATVSFHGTKPADLTLRARVLFVTDEKECQSKIYGSYPRMTQQRSIIVSAEPTVSGDGTRYEFSSALPVTFSETDATKCQYEFSQVYITYSNQYSPKPKTLLRLKFMPDEQREEKSLSVSDAISAVCSRSIGKQNVTDKDILFGGLICSDSQLTSRDQWLNRQNHTAYEINFIEGDYYQHEKCEYNEPIQALIKQGWVVDHHNNQFGLNRCEG